MKRRLLMVAGLSTMLIASVAPAPGMARTPERFGKVTTGRRADLSTITGLRGRDRKVMVAVELEGRPVAIYEGAASATGSELSNARKATLRTLIGRRQAVAKQRIERAGGDIQATYTDVFNGFRVRIRASKLDEVAAMPGVKAIHSVTKHTRANANTIAYIGADRTWAQTGFTGKGVKIAIIDSGINYYHADFDGAGYAAWKADDGLTRGEDFPTAKVVGGWDLAGDDYNADDADPGPQPRPRSARLQDGRDAARHPRRRHRGGLRGDRGGQGLPGPVVPRGARLREPAHLPRHRPRGEADGVPRLRLRGQRPT